MLKRRRAAIINKQSIPYGMVKVEYLESTSSQRIDTGLSVTPTIGAKVTASVTETPASSSNFKTTTGSSSMFSVANAFYKYPPKYRISFAYSNNPTDINYYVCKDGSIVNSNESGTMTDEKILTVNTFEPFIAELNYKNDKKYKFKNQEYNLIVDLPNTITSTYNESITLFVRRYAPNANNFSYGWNGIIYNATYTEGDEIKINFIPALDRTGTPCMFDKVTRKRFYNAGTGEFSYPRPNNIPSNYTHVDYLEKPKAILTYINILETPTNEHNIICTSERISNESNAVYGVRDDSYANEFSLWSGMTTVRFGSSSNKGNNGYDYVQNEKLFGKILSHQGKEFLINGELKATAPNPDKSFTACHPLILFATYRKAQGGNGIDSYAGSCRIYDFQMFRGNNIVRNLIPCLDPTGTPCMYDTVTQTPFYNSGTGDFLYPSPTSSTTYSMRRPQAEYAKMTDTGVRRLYHVPMDYEGSIEDYASENGYKLLNETDSPSEEGKYYNFRWVETDTELTTEWYEVEPPTDELGNPIENIDEPQSSTFNLQRPAPIDTTVHSNKSQWAMMTDTGVRRLYKTPKGYEGTLEDYAIQNGFKQLIETECPNEEGKYYSFRWVETDDTLMTEWFEVDPPQEEVFEEILDNPSE